MKSLNNTKSINGNYFDKETIKCLLKSEEDIENERTRRLSDVIKEFEEK